MGADNSPRDNDRSPRGLIDATVAATVNTKNLIAKADNVDSQLQARRGGKPSEFATIYRGPMERVVTTGQSAVANAVNPQLSTPAQESQSVSVRPVSPSDFKGAMFKSRTEEAAKPSTSTPDETTHRTPGLGGSGSSE